MYVQIPRKGLRQDKSGLDQAGLGTRRKWESSLESQQERSRWENKELRARELEPSCRPRIRTVSFALGLG